MPSFDIVSEIDMPEVRNGVENATRELSTRWDFRNVPASFELNEKNETIKVSSESDFQVQQLLDILRDKLAKRGIDGGALEIPEELEHSGKTYATTVKLKQGIDKELAKKVIKLIKDSKLKVQAQIQGEQVRVTGKARDDLQAVIALVKAAELGQPFQFNNFRD
ncbi:YajQ family cyclic di-GMP-binding protein [Frischella perrara]|uniref:YajQ family cyclic di-GMP-binding protein n=1 Tax=Frischella perrara TaxID=1267021 RepID=UPI0023F28C96|nr:YajQ family cyclic di-GMP-binding protein [Frischella perrara]MCT6875516.1 YajQ family cyclic di-GMP-binding protein [Frischella perrara]